MRESLKKIFLIYLLLLFYALILDRNINILNFKNWFHHLSLSNLIPFYNLFNSIKNVFLDGNYESLAIIIGNIIMLSPMAFFVPNFFKKVNNSLKFLIFIFLFSFFIEILQLMTDTGYFDIDDILLNSFGSLIFYFIFNKTSFKKFLDNIFFLECNKLSLSCIIYSVFVILLIIILFFLDIHFFYSEPTGTSMELICDKECNNHNYLIFEDANYKYYIDNECLDSLFIDFKTDKYLLADYVNGNVRKIYYDYYSFEDIQNRFSNYISKNSKFYESSFTYPSREITIRYLYDESYMVVESFDSYITTNNYTDFFRIKGIRSGEISLKIEIRDLFDDNVLDKYEIDYIIDDNLNVIEKDDLNN